MALWNAVKRWFTPARAFVPTQRIEVTPGLTVTLSRHELAWAHRTMTCWCYVTEGLATQGQKELVLALRQGSDDAAPASVGRSVLEFFLTVREFARQGTTVEVGDVTRFVDRTLLGRHVLYGPVCDLPGVSVPREALAAVLVTEAELSLAETAGPMRVLAALGQAHSHFPCPPWSDLERPELPAAALWEGSQLRRMPLARVPGARVLEQEGELVLRVAPGAEDVFRQMGEARPETAKQGFALLTDFDPSADAWLVWEPGQHEPRALTPPGGRGTRVGGCFVALLPGEAQADTSLRMEDGFAWFLTEASWAALWRALTAGQSLALMAEGGQRLRLEWVAR